MPQSIPENSYLTSSSLSVLDTYAEFVVHLIAYFFNTVSIVSAQHIFFCSYTVSSISKPGFSYVSLQTDLKTLLKYCICKIKHVKRALFNICYILCSKIEQVKLVCEQILTTILYRHIPRQTFEVMYSFPKNICFSKYLFMCKKDPRVVPVCTPLWTIGSFFSSVTHIILLFSTVTNVWLHVV